jgi:S1-C subfamily serine protease
MTEHRLMTRPSIIPTNGYPTTTTPPATTVEATPAGGAQGGSPPPPASRPPQPPQAPVPPHQPPRRRRIAWLIAAVTAGLVLMLVIVTGAFLAGRALLPSGQAQTSFGGSGVNGQAPAGPPAAAGPGVSSAQISSVAAKVDPGIVDINTVLGYQNGAAAGTGIVLSADGLVLTNNHVVAGATSISVTDIGNGQTYNASVVGYDRTQDIAVVKLSGASGLTVAPLGDPSTVSPGNSVVAIGNAGGTGGTPSAVGGTVTALDQSITAQDASTGASEQLTGLIEVAAAIQPGDSGGPLATTSGQVIGMNTAASAGFRYRAAGGDGYAIPINQATTIAKQIQAGRGSTTVHIGATAFLGIQTGPQAGSMGIGGAAVLGVLPGSPAQTTGLSGGDVIQSLNGQTIDSPTTLTGLLDQHHPGDRLTVGWIDATGQAHTATVIATTGPVG